jgi:hypothetical protein
MPTPTSGFLCKTSIVRVLLPLLACAPHCFAGDSFYKLTILNSTYEPIKISVTTSCTTFQSYPGGSISLPSDVAGAAYRVPPHKSAYYAYFRQSGTRCSGHDGTITFGFKQVAVWGGDLLDGGFVKLEYTTRHEVTETRSTPADRIIKYSFTPNADGDNDSILIRLYSKEQIGLREAIELGCGTPSDVTSSVTQLPLTSEVGGVTFTKSQAYTASASRATQQLVTYPIWGFRAVKYDLEVSSLQDGLILSKALISLRRRPGTDVSDFWNRNGPQLSGPEDAFSLGMRALAIANSDEPKSQFASVALDFATGAGFLEPNAYVYAFRVIPYSPILGLTQCSKAGGGEIQVQIFGGTPVYDLMRKSRTGNWQKWNPSTSSWYSADLTPSNDDDW